MSQIMGLRKLSKSKSRTILRRTRLRVSLKNIYIYNNFCLRIREGVNTICIWHSIKRNILIQHLMVASYSTINLYGILAIGRGACFFKALQNELESVPVIGLTLRLNCIISPNLCWTFIKTKIKLDIRCLWTNTKLFHFVVLWLNPSSIFNALRGLK